MSPMKGYPEGTNPTKSAHNAGVGINYSPTVTANRMTIIFLLCYDADLKESLNLLADIN